MNINAKKWNIIRYFAHIERYWLVENVGTYLRTSHGAAH